MVTNDVSSGLGSLPNVHSQRNKSSAIVIRNILSAPKAKFRGSGIIFEEQGMKVDTNHKGSTYIYGKKPRFKQ